MPFIWTQYPFLGFVDALAASYAVMTNTELVTFDTDFDRLPDIPRWSVPSDKNH